jgi:nicotinamidase-related amidase
MKGLDSFIRNIYPQELIFFCITRMKKMSSLLKYSFFLIFLSSHCLAQNIAVIIVDMQYGFYTSGRVLQTNGLIQLVSKQQELLTWAKKKKFPIIFFEYSGYQETDSALTNTLWGYRFKTITKFDDNGFHGPIGQEANQFLRANKVDTIVIAGINASGCVKRTAIGALQEGYQIISSGDIVADFYRNPPRYPQTEWFIDDPRFKGFGNLEELLTME